MKETLNTRLAKIVLLLVTVSVCSYAQARQRTMSVLVD